MKIIILGATGMLGHVLYRNFINDKSHSVFGTTQRTEDVKYFNNLENKYLIKGVNVFDEGTLVNAIEEIKPNLIINAVGLIKQKICNEDYRKTIYINALFPHILEDLGIKYNFKIIHMSTDCVFNGEKGMYVDTAPSDAYDLYGKSKYLGELHSKHCVTIRTSIIGHELDSKKGLLEWFLAQTETVNGFDNVFFSGFPTIEIFNIINNYLLDFKINGVYNISAKRISKYALLKIIKEVYSKDIVIKKVNEPIIDRSLNSERFQRITGYSCVGWDDLVIKMKNEEEYYKNERLF